MLRLSVAAGEFQFHKGTIKTVSHANALWTCIDFNSIKVRLKLHVTDTTYIKHKFQFHKGTIKTSPNLVDKLRTN